MAYNNYSSYSTSTLDAKDKHSEAELRKMDEAELKRQLKLAIDGNDDAYQSCKPNFSREDQK